MSPALPKPYTEPVHHLLTLAGQISSDLAAGYTGTEHLLLALLLFKEAGASRILRQRGITEEDLTRRLRNLMVTREPSDRPIPSTRPTDQVNQVLSDAIDEADRCGFPYVASEQILIALLRQEDTVAARVLQGAGFDLAAAREAVEELHARGAD